MSDDPIAQFERELLDAARRRATSADQMSARRGLRGRLGSGLAVAASVLVVLLIAGGALLLLHESASQPDLSSQSAAVSAWAKRLAVIARPQDHADQVALYRDGNDLPHGVVAPGSVRLARRTPWGGVVLAGVVVRGENAGRFVLTTSGRSDASTVTITPARLASGRLTASVVMPKRSSRFTRVVMPVPDGTAKVRLTVGGHSETVAVVGNVAAAQLPARCCSSALSAPPMPVIAYAADGRVLHRFKATAGFVSVGSVSSDATENGGN
jgi:hypothetical protein